MAIEKKRMKVVLLVTGVIALVLGGIGAIGAYERHRREDHYADQYRRFADLAEKMPVADRLRRLQVMHSKRLQPLDTVARKEVRKLTGSRKLFGIDPVLTLMSLAFDPPSFWDETPCILVQHGKNKERLGIEPAENLASPQQVRESSALGEVRQELMSAEGNLSSVDQEVFMLFGKQSALKKGYSDLFVMIPPTHEQRMREEDANRNDWYKAGEAAVSGWPAQESQHVVAAYDALGDAWRNRDAKGVLAAADDLEAACKGLSVKDYLSAETVDAELRFNRINPFGQASMLYAAMGALAIFAFAFSMGWLRWASIVCGLGAIGLQAWGFTNRVMLGNSPAITNLYESMVAVAGAIGLICVIVDITRKGHWALIGGGVGAAIILLTVDTFSVKYDDAIGGTIAVLSNNYWVHIHVPVVMTSYAAFFVSFLLGLIAHFWVVYGDRQARSPELRSLLKTAGIAVNVGTPLIFAGLILGGVWAQESWGRFWGWDPKETWALVLFVYYCVPIHARFTKLINPFWDTMSLLLGGVVLLWTYYGTNEFLSGLHSYAGSSQTGTIWANLFHEKNIWFTASTGAILALALVSFIVYQLTGGGGAAEGEAVVEDGGSEEKARAQGTAKAPLDGKGGAPVGI